MCWDEATLSFAMAVDEQLDRVKEEVHIRASVRWAKLSQAQAACVSSNANFNMAVFCLRKPRSCVQRSSDAKSVSPRQTSGASFAHEDTRCIPCIPVSLSNATPSLLQPPVPGRPLNLPMNDRSYNTLSDMAFGWEQVFSCPTCEI